MHIAIIVLFFCTCGLIGLFVLLFSLIKKEAMDVDKYLNLYNLEITKQKTLLQKGDHKRNKLEKKIQICKKQLKEKR